MDILRIEKSLQENTPINAIHSVNQSLCSVVVLLSGLSIDKKSLSPESCSRLGIFIAQQSRELLKAELRLKKQGGSYE